MTDLGVCRQSFVVSPEHAGVGGRPGRIYFLRDEPQLSSLEMAATFAPFLLSPPFALYLLSPPYGPYLLSPPIGHYLLSPPFTAIVLSVI